MKIKEEDRIMRRNSEADDYGKKGIYIKGTVVGVGFGIVISIVLILIAAGFVAAGKVSNSGIVPIVIVISGVAAMAGGIVSGLCIGHRGILWGSICGLGLWSIIYIAGISMEAANFGISTVRFAIMIIFSGIGGIIGVNIKQK